MGSTFDDTRLSSYTNAEIVHYVQSRPRLPEHSNIIPLSSKYLAKSYPKDELEDAVRAMEFASQLGIHVPRIRRIVQATNGFYCIMDRISGKPLNVAWPELGWIASLRLALKLRQNIRRLRSYYLDDFFGLPPRAPADHVNAFLNFWANFVTPRQEVKKTPAEHSICPRPVFSSTQPFVFTHHDLAPRNIILDREGQLWLIDWDVAGFYPKFFEHAGMHNFIPTVWDKFTLWRWRLFAWIASGFYDRESWCLEIIRSRFTRFRPLRRFNMRANGYAAVFGRPDNDVG